MVIGIISSNLRKERMTAHLSYNENMLISIVIPVYNVEKYLKTCIESVLDQTYRDIEIILVDDGSTDSSGSICDEYAKKDSRITVIHKKNRGLGLARNSGMELVKGSFVTFLDSDDYISSTNIQELAEIVEKEGADTVLGGFSRVDVDGNVLAKEAYDFKIYSDKEVQSNFFPRLMGSSPTHKDSIRPSVWNSMYSMDIIRKNNILFKSEREYAAEDIVFDIEYYRYAQKVVTISTASYNYRVTPGSLTQKYRPDRFDKSVFLYKYIFARLKELGYSGNASVRAARQLFVYTRMAIKQEVICRDRKFSEKYKQIRRIINDKFLRSVISNYPVEKLSLQPKVFLYLIKFRLSLLIYALIKIKG